MMSWLFKPYSVLEFIADEGDFLAPFLTQLMEE